MKVYGIYENDKYEQCVYVGTIKEISKEFGNKENSLRRILSRGDKTIQGKKKRRYLIKELYNEKKGEKDDFSNGSKRKSNRKGKTKI